MFKFLKDSRKVAIALTLAFALLLGGAGISGAFSRRSIAIEQEELPSYSSSAAETSESSEPEPEPEPSESSEPEPEPEPSESSEPEEAVPLAPVVKKEAPKNMRAVMLRPGEDFLTGELSESRVKSELDGALKSAKELTMNTVIIDLKYKNGVIYKSSYLPDGGLDFDVLECAVSAAKDSGMFVYGGAHQERQRLGAGRNI